MKYVIIAVLSVFAVACNNGPRPVAQADNTANTAAAPKNERAQTAIAHSSEKQTPPPTSTGSKSGWTQSGDPIDTKESDAAVAKAEKDVAAKPSDAAAKKALSQAFFDRGMKLTDARQYAAALGDYRRAIKNDPSNAEAKEWIEKIVGIYESINRSYPKEGEEPPALPFNGSKP